MRDSGSWLKEKEINKIQKMSVSLTITYNKCRVSTESRSHQSWSMYVCVT